MEDNVIKFELLFPGAKAHIKPRSTVILAVHTYLCPLGAAKFPDHQNFNLIHAYVAVFKKSYLRFK
jgi:hypothetical protein